jgi:hypothetical protein
LRYQVDDTEMDEVYVDDEGEKSGLSSLSTDAAGAAVIGDEERPSGRANDPIEPMPS